MWIKIDKEPNFNVKGLGFFFNARYQNTTQNEKMMYEVVFFWSSSIYVRFILFSHYHNSADDADDKTVTAEYLNLLLGKEFLTATFLNDLL